MSSLKESLDFSKQESSLEKILQQIVNDLTTSMETLSFSTDQFE